MILFFVFWTHCNNDQLVTQVAKKYSSSPFARSSMVYILFSWVHIFCIRATISGSLFSIVSSYGMNFDSIYHHKVLTAQAVITHSGAAQIHIRA